MAASGPPYLVVAGEASGDAMAARVVARIGQRALGMGGPALREAGAELVIEDLGLAAMGPLGAARRAARLTRAYRRLVACASEARMRVALLVGFSAFNARLGRELKRRGLRVLWYSPPQVWAWRSSRVKRLAQSCNQVALLFPFEAELWRTTRVDVEHVGHPSLELRYEARDDLRRRLGLGARDVAIALLPGSRDGEARRTLEPMLAAVQRLKQNGSVQASRCSLLLAPSLSPELQRRARASAAHVGACVSTGCETLPAFDAAFATSGTITLECALAQVPPVIVYRTDPLTAWLARRLLETPYVGLPNAILGRPAFPELLQNRVNAATLATEMQQVLTRRESYREACLAVRARTERPGAALPSERVARLLETWLS